jgi:type II secretory pathway component PulF
MEVPFIVTPGQLTQRAEFYQQLGQLTGAGLGILQALQHISRHPPGRSYTKPIGQLIAGIAEGFTFTEAIKQLGSWLPAFDIAVLHAGEQSGRLDTCFGLLADHYSDRARLARQVLADLAYPAFLFHFAVFIFPFAQLFTTGNWVAYIGRCAVFLVPVYAIAALAIYATQSRHGETWRAVMENLLDPVPLLGTARRYLALSRLAGALEALISAGVSIIEAWELAAVASGSPALRRTVYAWRPLVSEGQTPGEAVSASSFFPELFASQYNSGEISGKLDDALHRLQTYYQEEGSRKLHAVVQWTPRLIYLLVALMIAYYVINFWTGYFNQIQKAIG